MIVVEILGRAGTGKSTVCHEAIATLQKKLPCCVVLENRWPTTRIEDLLWCVRNPPLALLAWRLSRITTKKRLRFWLLRLARRDRQRKDWNSDGRPTIVLADMGLLHFLNKASDSLPDDILSQLPLPDVVILLKASICDSAWRRVRRSAKAFPILQQRGAANRAVGIARQFLQERGEEETLRFLQFWNRQSGEQGLSTEALHRLFETAREMPPAITEPPGKTYHFKSKLLARGVPWFEVDNSADRELPDVARDVVDIVYQCAVNACAVSASDKELYPAPEISKE